MKLPDEFDFYDMYEELAAWASEGAGVVLIDENRREPDRPIDISRLRSDSYTPKYIAWSIVWCQNFEAVFTHETTFLFEDSDPDIVEAFIKDLARKVRFTCGADFLARAVMCGLRFRDHWEVFENLPNPLSLRAGTEPALFAELARILSRTTIQTSKVEFDTVDKRFWILPFSYWSLVKSDVFWSQWAELLDMNLKQEDDRHKQKLQQLKRGAK